MDGGLITESVGNGYQLIFRIIAEGQQGLAGFQVDGGFVKTGTAHNIALAVFIGEGGVAGSNYRSEGFRIGTLSLSVDFHYLAIYTFPELSVAYILPREDSPG